MDWLEENKIQSLMLLYLDLSSVSTNYIVFIAKQLRDQCYIKSGQTFISRSQSDTECRFSD